MFTTLHPTINLSQREAVILALVTTAKNLRTIADELPELEMFAELCRINASANDKLADEIKATPAPTQRSELDDLLHKDIMRIAEKCGAMDNYPKGKTFDAYIAFDWIASHLETKPTKRIERSAVVENFVREFNRDPHKNFRTPNGNETQHLMRHIASLEGSVPSRSANEVARQVMENWSVWPSNISHPKVAAIIQQANQTAVDDALEAFIADLDRECGFTAYAPTVRAVQAAKKMARALAEQPKGGEND